jgi:hypothetical protein
MPGPAALIALAARLGIPKGAKIIAEKGFKYLQKLVTKAEKQIAKQRKTSGKKFIGKKSKSRKEVEATQRKKPKIDAGLSIRQKMAKDLDLPANYGQRDIRKALERKDLPEELKRKYQGRGDVPRKEEWKKILK